MPECKFYSIKPDGHISEPPTVTECPDDPTAIGKARQARDGYDIEIWEGPRVVAYLIPSHFP